MKRVLLTLAILLFSNLIYGQGDAEKLEIILSRLIEINSASYHSKTSSSAPGDTLAFTTHENFVNMYVDTTDKYLGARYAVSDKDNPFQFNMCYDGTYSVRFDWKNKSVAIDTLTDNPYSRPMSPFFIKVKSLIAYTLNNLHDENTKVVFHEYQDSIKVKFSFNNSMVEFMWLTPFVNNSAGLISRYEVVLDKAYLPYKFVRRMPHQSSWETCTDIQISKEMDFEFNSIQQIPPDFEIKGRERGKPKSYELEGLQAPEWKLKEIYGDSVSLNAMKKKVVLIQFTGIGCGPCHASIPFLKKLANDYKDKDFELISIETWSNNIAGIERYKDKNEMNYKFLVSANEIEQKYKVEGVPSFFILDDKKMIKKVIVGYQKEVTDKLIVEIINKML